MGFRQRLTRLEGVQIDGATISGTIQTAKSGPRAVLRQTQAASGGTSQGELAFLGDADNFQGGLTASSGQWGAALELDPGGGGPSLTLSREDAPTAGKWNVASITGADALRLDGVIQRPWARLVANGPQSGLTGTWQLMQLGAQADPFGLFGATPWDAVIKEHGIYLVEGEVVFASNANNPVRNSRIFLNGNTFPGCAGQSSQPGAGDGLGSVTGAKVLELFPGDKVALQGYSSANWGTAYYPDNATNLQLVRIL